MKLSLYTLILPRAEVFFLEEWIIHYLELGVDKIYLYDNGVTNISSSFTRKSDMVKKSNSLNNVRKLSPKEVGIKNIRRPDSDYFLEYTDKEIYQKLYEVVAKFPKQVSLVSWKNGLDHNLVHPGQQNAGWRHCVSKNKSDWWLHLDPDEFIIFYKNINLKDLIEKSEKTDVSCVRFKQKVFDSRKRNAPVRDIFNWGYVLEKKYKTLIKSDIKNFHIHNAIPNSGEVRILNKTVGMFYHYRGHPLGQGGVAHLKKIDSQFNRIDKRMNKYVY